VKGNDDTTRKATDVAEAIATANQVGNGQFETKVGPNNEIISERK